jgi:hypothetical protein
VGAAIVAYRRQGVIERAHDLSDSRRRDDIERPFATDLPTPQPSSVWTLSLFA